MADDKAGYETDPVGTTRVRELGTKRTTEAQLNSEPLASPGSWL